MNFDADKAKVLGIETIENGVNENSVYWRRVKNFYTESNASHI